LRTLCVRADALSLTELLQLLERFRGRRAVQTDLLHAVVRVLTLASRSMCRQWRLLGGFECMLALLTACSMRIDDADDDADDNDDGDALTTPTIMTMATPMVQSLSVSSTSSSASSSKSSAASNSATWLMMRQVFRVLTAATRRHPANRLYLWQRS
jgi:hypothetical protein